MRGNRRGVLGGGVFAAWEGSRFFMLRGYSRELARKALPEYPSLIAKGGALREIALQGLKNDGNRRGALVGGVFAEKETM